MIRRLAAAFRRCVPYVSLLAIVLLLAAPAADAQTLPTRQKERRERREREREEREEREREKRERGERGYDEREHEEREHEEREHEERERGERGRHEPRPVREPFVGTPRTIDDFDSAAAWKPVPADGVEMTLTAEPATGAHGRALRIDFRFVKGGGYAVLHRDVAIDLPENWKFTYRLRGDAPNENLEFKLVDSTGANVWWLNRRDVAFPRDWEPQTVKQRHVSFAWGPAGGGEIRHVAAIEFAVTAGSGGRGTVWLDDLALTPLPPADATPPAPRAVATSERAGHLAGMAVDGDAATSWASGPRDRRPYLELDLGTSREFGGVTLDWTEGRAPRNYVIDASDDRVHWRVLRTVTTGRAGRTPLRLPESEARRVRLRVLDELAGRYVELREFTIEPLAWGATPEAFFKGLATAAPPGEYPRGITGEQAYWTVVGDVAGDRDEGLLGEDGQLEMGKRRATLEPFLYTDGRLLTWADVALSQRLDAGHRERFGPNGDWPLPVVDWTGGPLELSVTAFAVPDSTVLPRDARAIGGASTRLVARYRIRNPRDRRATGTFYLAVRPFQVNPPTQFLNTPGGTAAVRKIERRGAAVVVDDAYGLVCVTPPAAFGACAFDGADVVATLRHGRLPAATRVTDAEGTASAALAWTLSLAPGADTTISVVVPLHEAVPSLARGARERTAAAALEAARNEWDARRRGIAFHARDAQGRPTLDVRLPFNAATASIWPQLGWILANRDGAAIQPGARAYERSWIRDGALTSSALLRLGQPDLVKPFIEWFAPYQYADGKVPCCVDGRGSDPVPEHDSHGEFIYLVAEYWRYTGDRSMVERMWPHVLAAAHYLDSLRAQRRTAEWRTPAKREFYGLLPPSISHEGYSAKPMHSYWDDLFALRGYKDAVVLAGVLGRGADRVRLAKSRDEFARDLGASIRAAMAKHQIDFIPGCADLGDFDATSTTIALNPVQADGVVSDKALRETFEQYWEFFDDRRRGVDEEWQAYTPYELRAVGAFVRLGWRERAGDALAWFRGGQQPEGWRQWPEVVAHDPRTPHFLGDLPHTWVGSDYVRSVLDMFGYSRERDSTLVVGAGIQQTWVEGGGLELANLPTPYGPLGMAMRAVANGVDVELAPGLIAPRGGIVVSPPAAKPWRSVRVDGRPAMLTREGVVLRATPAKVEFRR